MESLNRRRFLGTAAAFSATALNAVPTQAQPVAWPVRPVKLILPYQPGGATDLIARPWADKLTQAFGQQFVVENRGGASGSIGAEAASKAPPDGYTFMLTPNGPLSILPHFRKTAYDPAGSFLPVGRVGDLMNGYAVHPSVGITTFAEMVDYAKKHPGKLAYGSAGPATSSHLRLERTKHGLGLDILHVPYRGNGDAINDLLAGNIHLMNEINPMPHVKAGKLRLLNLSAPARHPEFPDVPTDAELKIDHLAVLSWYAIWAPAGTPVRNHKHAQWKDAGNRARQRDACPHAGSQCRLAPSIPRRDECLPRQGFRWERRHHQSGQYQVGITTLLCGAQ